jgi:hypothetical protein
VALVAGLGACAHGADAPADNGSSGEFQALGEIAFRDHSASFDDNRVVGPNINVSRRSDGSWGGVAGGIGQSGSGSSPIDVSVNGTRLTGVDLTLSWEETPKGVSITGQFQGRIMRFEVSDTQVVVRSGGYGALNAGDINRQGNTGASSPFSVTLPRVDQEHFGNGNFILSGKASDLHPPEPQFALAMLGAFD